MSPPPLVSTAWLVWLQMVVGFLGQLRLQLSQGEVLMGNMQIAFWLGS